MVGLKCNVVGSDRALQGWGGDRGGQVTRGFVGPHVRKIQAALIYLDSLSIDQSELKTCSYGPSTAAAVLAFKKARKIVNRAYQTTEDDIVGIMTIAAMDRELHKRQVVPPPGLPKPCLCHCKCGGGGHPRKLVTTVALRARVGCQKTGVDF